MLRAISYCILQSRPVARSFLVGSLLEYRFRFLCLRRRDIVIKNFTMIDPAGIDGKGVMGVWRAIFR